jgi:hypothetical protein
MHFDEAAVSAAIAETESAMTVAKLIGMGATKTTIVDRLGFTREVHIEHPELPGVLIIPIDDELRRHPDERSAGTAIINKLASALAEERNTPNGD